MNSITYTLGESVKDLMFNEYAFDSSQLDTFGGKVGIKDASITDIKISENASISPSKVAGLVDNLGLLRNQVNGLLSQGIWRETFATIDHMLNEFEDYTVYNDWSIGDYVDVIVDNSIATSIHTPGASSTYVINLVDGIKKLVFRRDIPATMVIATNTAAGIVMGNNTPGGIIVDSDGKMELFGYDQINSGIISCATTINNVTTELQNLDVKFTSQIAGITTTTLQAATVEQGMKADSAVQSVSLRKDSEDNKLVLSVDGSDQDIVELLLGSMAYENSNDYVRIDATTGPIATITAEQQALVTQQQLLATSQQTLANEQQVLATSQQKLQQSIDSQTTNQALLTSNQQTMATTISGLTTTTTNLGNSVNTISTNVATVTKSVSDISTITTNLNKNTSEGSWGEIDTGRTFRGKKIYRQDFTLYVSGASANVVVDLTLIPTANYVDDIISIGGWWTIGYQTERWAIGCNDGSNYSSVIIFGNNNLLTFRSKANSSRNNAQAIIIVEYTKK